MSRNSLLVIVIAIVVILSAVIYFAVKKTGATSIIPGTGTGGNPDGGYSPNATGNFPLRLGSKGDSVKLLQLYMNNLGKTFDLGTPLIPDGDWGSKTQAAFALMQSKVEFIASPNLITEEEFNNYIQPHQYLLSYVG